jgi:hypothetical protein
MDINQEDILSDLFDSFGLYFGYHQYTEAYENSDIVTGMWYYNKYQQLSNAFPALKKQLLTSKTGLDLAVFDVNGAFHYLSPNIEIAKNELAYFSELITDKYSFEKLEELEKPEEKEISKLVAGELALTFRQIHDNFVINLHRSLILFGSNRNWST